MFRGLVIAVTNKDNQTRDTELHNYRMTERAKISGGLLLGPQSSTNWILGLDLNNQAAIYYSSQDLAMAYSLCPECFPNAVAKIIAWHGK